MSAGDGIGAVLTYAVGAAISPLAIVAVILTLFSARARVNGPLFVAGWVLSLAAVSGVAYALADAGGVATDSTADDSASWGKIVFGVLLLLVAARRWRSRPAPGTDPETPKWMAGIDSFSPGKAFTFGLIAAAAPKNFLLSAAAGVALAELGLSTGDALVSLVVYVVVGSLTIAGPVVYYLMGGERAKSALDSTKEWLMVHNAAVTTVVLVVFGVKLIADGLPALT
jgi:Sap-like sulfolipid-1-addressing protein